MKFHLSGTFTTLTTYKYTKDKNLVSNQYTLFDSLRFSQSDSASPPVKTYANIQALLEEK